jgi:hypothetical protein
VADEVERRVPTALLEYRIKSLEDRMTGVENAVRTLPGEITSAIQDEAEKVRTSGAARLSLALRLGTLGAALVGAYAAFHR